MSIEYTRMVKLVFQGEVLAEQSFLVLSRTLYLEDS